MKPTAKKRRLVYRLKRGERLVIESRRNKTRQVVVLDETRVTARIEYSPCNPPQDSQR